MGTLPKSTDMRTKTRRIKTLAKSIGAMGYTPLTSRTLANVLYDLSTSDPRRRIEVIGLFSRISEGKTK